MVTFLQELCALSGVSSREDAVRAYLVEQVRPCADWLHTDHFGNLIAFKKGTSDEAPILLDAAMDETGVMISGHTDDGSLRFQCVGGIDRRTLIGKRVYLGEEKRLGVFGMKPIHLSSRDERKNVPEEKELYIDIGCRKKDEARKLVPLGTVGSFDADCGPFGSGLFRGKALYSRVGCAVLLCLMREELKRDTVFVFSAQREVGARGAFGAAMARYPEVQRADTVITLDGCAAWDFPNAASRERTAEVGKGIVLSHYGDHAAYDRSLFEQLRRLAETNELPWQVMGGPHGSPNAAIYTRQGAGRATGAVSVPVRYRNAPMGIVSLRDCEAMLKLLKAVVAG